MNETDWTGGAPEQPDGTFDRDQLHESEICLREIQLPIDPVPWTPQATEFVRDGQSRFKKINCFGFVPSNYTNAWYLLNHVHPGTFCEWGSGLGIVVGLAEMLGFSSSGIEIDETLAEQSRSLLRDHGLQSKITTGSFLDECPVVDYYYVYCWPSQTRDVEQRFLDIAPEHGRLLICYGQDRLQCMAKPINPRS